MDVSGASWRKSSHSGGNNNDCLEAAWWNEDALVRDSKNPSGPILRFRPKGWASLLSALKRGGLPA